MKITQAIAVLAISVNINRLFQDEMANLGK